MLQKDLLYCILQYIIDKTSGNNQMTTVQRAREVEEKQNGLAMCKMGRRMIPREVLNLKYEGKRTQSLWKTPRRREQAGRKEKR